MDIKEYIKSLVRQELDEMSTTAGVPGYLTPAAFGKKGQKTNAATKYAEKEGWKKVSGMPKNSKMLDYKELWPGKKSSMNETLLHPLDKSQSVKDENIISLLQYYQLIEELKSVK